MSSKRLLRLLVKLSAPAMPFSCLMRLYIGINPVATPALTKENIVVGIVCAIK